MRGRSTLVSSLKLILLLSIERLLPMFDIVREYPGQWATCYLGIWKNNNKPVFQRNAEA